LHPLELLAAVFGFKVTVEVAEAARELFHGCVFVAEVEYLESWQSVGPAIYYEPQHAKVVWAETYRNYGVGKVGPYVCPDTDPARSPGEYSNASTVLLSSFSRGDEEEDEEQAVRAARASGDCPGEGLHLDMEMPELDYGERDVSDLLSEGVKEESQLTAVLEASKREEEEEQKIPVEVKEASQLTAALEASKREASALASDREETLIRAQDLHHERD
jgi:hypothetical protein